MLTFATNCGSTGAPASDRRGRGCPLSKANSNNNKKNYK